MVTITAQNFPALHTAVTICTGLHISAAIALDCTEMQAVAANDALAHISARMFTQFCKSDKTAQKMACRSSMALDVARRLLRKAASPKL